MTQIKRSVRRNFNLDLPLTFILISLSVISLTAIYAAIPLMPSFNGSYDLIIKQSIFIGLSLFFLIVLLYLGIDVIFNAIDWAYWILMGLLFLLLLDRVIDLPLISPINGTRAWIYFPGLGTLQPSEFMKAVLIIKAAIIIQDHHDLRGLPSIENDFHLFFDIAKIAFLPLLLIVLQPDTGIPLVIVAGLIAMLAMSGVHINWIKYGFLFIAFIVSLFMILFFFFPTVLVSLVGESYRLTRFYGWLQTEKYVLSWGLQLYQALLAIGSAGLFGHGYASNVINLIEPQNDFIFAVIGQNFGFLGTAITLGLHLALDLVIVNILSQSIDYREKIMVSGVLGMLVFQQIQNMAMIVGLLPITGITLPLISAGGSSLLSFVPSIAVIFALSHEVQAARLH
jgi:rod shape determining protein RodA